MSMRVGDESARARAESIDSGNARRKLAELVELTNAA